MKQGKISFAIAAIAAGQKSSVVNAEPELIARSTVGGFTITAPVSKALNIPVGGNVMFLNNIAGINDAIARKTEDAIAVAEELGVDIDTPEGQDKIREAATTWYIAKGVKLYKANGQPLMATERISKKDKEAFIKEHADEILEGNRAALVERVGDENASDDELKAAITVDDLKVPEYHAMSGSKTASTGSAKGVGVQLNFTDSSIWTALKADLGDEASKNVRTYKVDIQNPETVVYNDGHEDVTIPVYPIEFEKDAEPQVRLKKDNA